MFIYLYLIKTGKSQDSPTQIIAPYRKDIIYLYQRRILYLFVCSFIDLAYKDLLE